MTSTINKTDVTTTGASETPEPAVGSGTSQQSSSRSQTPVKGVPSLAPFAGNITAEKVVWCTQRKSGFVGEKDMDLHDRSLQVTIGELVGSPKSTSGDRGDTGVASQAPVPFTTGAETVVSQMDTQPSIVGGSGEQPLSSAMENVDTDKVPRLPKPRVVLYNPERIQLGWQDEQMAVGSGLDNTGVICYINSTLQALFHIPAFANWLLNDEQHQKTCQQKTEFSKDCVVCMVRETFKLTQKKTGCSFIASIITNRLSLICKYLSVYRQEDAHEFLCYLIESMERCYLSALGHSAKSLDNYSIETTPIHQIFSGYIRTEVTCGNKCGYVSTTYQNFKDMILDIGESENVNDALEKFFVTESLDGFTCEGCQRQGAAEKSFTIEKPPNVLCVQLKRYNYDMSGRQSKNCKPIKINRKIYLKLNDKPPLRYHLVSMVNHHGRTLDSGHYTTLGLTPYGYYYFNDSNVYQTNFKEHSSKSTDSYIIFYELKPSENKTNKPPADDKPNIKVIEPNERIVTEHQNDQSESPPSIRPYLSMPNIKIMTTSDSNAEASVLNDGPAESNSVFTLEDFAGPPKRLSCSMPNISISIPTFTEVAECTASIHVSHNSLTCSSSSASEPSITVKTKRRSWWKKTKKCIRRIFCCGV